MHFIAHTAILPGHRATYLRIVASIRPQKAEPKCIRFTVGGNLVQYPGKVSTPTADITTAKLLFNSVLSTPAAKFMCIDIKDFNLGTPMACYEYMHIPVPDIPPIILAQYQLAPLIHNNSVTVEIRKGMYSLPQAGILAHDRLVEHLARHGYVKTAHTAGLFRHVTRPIQFTLVVDDFGVKYTGTNNAQHLIDTLQALYTITIDWDGTRYLGLTLAWNYEHRTLDMSMPDYIDQALTRFQRSPPTKPQHAPHRKMRSHYLFEQSSTNDIATSHLQQGCVDQTPGKDNVSPEVQLPTAKRQVASVPHTTNHSPTVPTNIQEYNVDS
jgi:hypothetical protein